MHLKDVRPDKVTFVKILHACAGDAAVAEGKWIHACILKSGLACNIVVNTALVNMYGKCGSLEDAREVFDKMLERDVTAWTAMIVVCAQHGQGQEALYLFCKMKQQGVPPDRVTYVSVLDACACHAALFEGKQAHASFLYSGLSMDVVMGTALVNLYGKCNCLVEAESAFANMPKRNVHSWTAMLGVYAQNGQGNRALELFGQMWQEGVMPDRVTFVSVLDACASQAALVEGELTYACILNMGIETDAIVSTSLVYMYGKCGRLENAWHVFHNMHIRTKTSWNALIAVYAEHGQGKEVFKLFIQMQQEGYVPDKLTFVSIFNVCACQVELDESMRMHACMLFCNFEPDVVIGTGIINMYSKCGSLRDAQKMFDMMPDRNAFSWNTLIALYAQHGDAKRAFQLFGQMQKGGIMPDSVTFVSLLSACGHSGLVDECCQCFTSMNLEYGISPVVHHYNCMIDLYGRAGQLDDAENLISSMPCQPTNISFLGLLSACWNEVDLEHGECAADHVIELDPDNAVAYIILSNVCSAAGRKIMEYSQNLMVTSEKATPFCPAKFERQQ